MGILFGSGDVVVNFGDLILWFIVVFFLSWFSFFGFLVFLKGYGMVEVLWRGNRVVLGFVEGEGGS